MQACYKPSVSRIWCVSLVEVALAGLSGGALRSRQERGLCEGNKSRCVAAAHADEAFHAPITSRACGGLRGRTMGALVEGLWGNGGGSTARRARCPRGNRLEIRGEGLISAEPLRGTGTFLLARPPGCAVASSSLPTVSGRWRAPLLLPRFGEVGRPWNRSSPAVRPCRSPPLPPEDGFKGLLLVPRGLRVPRNSVCSPELGKCSYTKKEQKRALSLSSAVFQPARTHKRRMCCIESSSRVVLGQRENPG